MNYILLTVFLILFGVFANGYERLFQGVDQNLLPNQIVNSIYSEDIFSVRQELHIDVFEKDDTTSAKFKSKGIKRWHSIAINGEIFLIGTRKEGITLVSMYKERDFYFQVHEFPIDFKVNVSCAALFKARSSQGKKFEANVIVATQSSQTTVNWYRIKDYKLELVTKWSLESEIKEIFHFEHGTNSIVSFLEYYKEDFTFKCYGYSFDTSSPHIWLLERLPLEKGVISAEIIANEKATFLATVQDDKKNIIIYHSEVECTKNCRFEILANIQGINANKIQSLTALGTKYLAVSGNPSTILSINKDEQISIVNTFPGISELMMLNVPTKRGDLIILGKNSTGFVEVFTLSLPESSWLKRQLPPCLKSEEEHPAELDGVNGGFECLGDKQWQGASFIYVDESPTIIFPGENVELVHVICSLRAAGSALPSMKYWNWLTDLRKEFQVSWRKFGSGLDSLLSPTPKSSNENSWSNICDMHEEINNILKVLNAARLNLNSIECKDEQKSELEKSSKARYADKILISYRKSSDKTMKEETSINTGKTTKSLTSLYVTKYRKSIELATFTTNPYRTAITTELEDEYSNDNGMIVQPLLSMITKKFLNDKRKFPF